MYQSFLVLWITQITYPRFSSNPSGRFMSLNCSVILLVSTRNVHTEVYNLRYDQSPVRLIADFVTNRDVVLCEETLGTSDKKSTGNFAQITQSLLPKFPAQPKHNFHYDEYG